MELFDKSTIEKEIKELPSGILTILSDTAISVNITSIAIVGGIEFVPGFDGVPYLSPQQIRKTSQEETYQAQPQRTSRRSQHDLAARHASLLLPECPDVKP